MFPTIAQLRLAQYVYNKSLNVNINNLQDLTGNITNPIARFRESSKLLKAQESKTKAEVNIELNKEQIIYQNLSCCYLNEEILVFSFGSNVNKVVIDSTVSITDLVNSYMIRYGYWIEEYIGSHLHVISDSDEVSITNGWTCDCEAFKSSGYVECIHTKFARMYLQNRQKLDFMAVVYD